MIDITKTIDNFVGTEEELQNIAETVYELVDTTSYPDDDMFMDKCESMLRCDYDYLTDDQFYEVYNMIEKIIEELYKK